LLDARPGLAKQLHVSHGASREELDRGLAEAEVLLAGRFEAEAIERRAPRLRWVQSIFAGVEKIVSSVPPTVAITNAGGVHAGKAGEYAIGGILMLNNVIPTMIAQQRQRAWNPVYTSSLKGKGVAILGTGHLGSAVARHCGHFGMVVTGISRLGRAEPGFDRVVRVDELAGVLPGCAFVVVTLPNTPGTRMLLGPTEFGLLPPGAGLVSIGRGQVINEAAMVDALASGRLGGAMLDVLEKEPLPRSSPLWGLPNVVITPHCGVDDPESDLSLALEVFVDNLVRYTDGRPLRNLVDRDAGY